MKKAARVAATFGNIFPLRYNQTAPQGVGVVPRRKAPFSLRSYSKGCGADGKQAMGESPSLRGVLTRHPLVDDLHIPKSVLAAWLPPGGQRFV